MGDIIKKIKQKRQDKKRIKNAPDLPEKNDPFYIDRNGKQYSKEDYYNEFGSSKTIKSNLKPNKRKMKKDGASAKFPEIKKKNEGKFTAWVEKNMGGMDTCKAASKVMKSRTKKYSPAVVKMANYANNFGCKTKREGGSSVPLQGKQNNLPAGLKAKILASDGASMEKEPKEKGKIKQAVENFKTRNELVAYKRKNPKPGEFSNVVTTKKKAKKLEKKETKAASKAAKAGLKSSSKPSKTKSVKIKKPKNAKYGIQSGKKGFQKLRKK